MRRPEKSNGTHKQSASKATLAALALAAALGCGALAGCHMIAKIPVAQADEAGPSVTNMQVNRVESSGSRIGNVSTNGWLVALPSPFGTNSSSTTDSSTKADTSSASSWSVQIKQSPDKYTWYVKNYVGANAASIGYTSLGGDRRDSYGAGTVKLVLVTADGTYVDPEDEDALKDYVVIAQNLEPNTEIKYTFLKNSSGEEYSNLIDAASQEEIVLEVAKVGEAAEPSLDLVATEASDRYTRHVRSYVGRNLAACGYISLGGDLRDSYGETTVKLVIVTSDGTYVDQTDEEALQMYRVVDQNLEPNTPIVLTYLTDSDGKEYDNLVDSASVEEISLLVERIAE
jgi:hypothetical protein